MTHETFLTSIREPNYALSALPVRCHTINQLWAGALARNLNKNHMTRTEFATRVGVSEARVYKWLVGGSITLDSTERPAKVLKVRPSRLFSVSAANRSAIDTWYGRAA